MKDDTIKLAVYRIPSTSPTPAPDPVVYLDGGPGSSGVSKIAAFAVGPAAYLRQRSDIIVIDQRGTGYSQPDLFCPEVFKTTAEGGNLAARHQACHDRLISEGVDFADYNSAYNAQDVNAVREALGYAEWNLYGVSYGTRLALTAMRDLPDGVRSVVLDSVFPPEINGLSEFSYSRYWAIEQIATNCAADVDCSANIGDIKALIEDGIARLSIAPVATPIVNFTAFVYMTLLPELMTQPELATWITIIATGTDAEISGVVQQVRQRISELNPQANATQARATAVLYPFVVPLSEGMFQAVTCGEEKPFLDITAGPNIAANFRESTQFTVNQIGQGFIKNSLCDIYTVPARDEIETQPVLSSIPTLVLADTNDSRTPPAWSKLAADTLDNSQYAEFEGFGHGLLGKNLCINKITLDFLNNPDSTVDQTCINRLPKVDYVTDINSPPEGNDLLD
jgi:pimeloyl-ACP methyl ester carboxylesterase